MDTGPVPEIRGTERATGCLGSRKGCREVWGCAGLDTCVCPCAPRRDPTKLTQAPLMKHQFPWGWIVSTTGTLLPLPRELWSHHQGTKEIQFLASRLSMESEQRMMAALGRSWSQLWVSLVNTPGSLCRPPDNRERAGAMEGEPAPQHPERWTSARAWAPQGTNSPPLILYIEWEGRS